MTQLAPPLRDDPINAVPWRRARPPARVLVIRLQAFGDTVITLPYVQALQSLWPETEIDLLTRDEVAELPRNVALFHDVFAMGGGRSAKRQLIASLGLLPRLLARRYDVVLDLQRSRVSRFVRRLLRPSAWSEFDRFSPRLAG